MKDTCGTMIFPTLKDKGRKIHHFSNSFLDSFAERSRRIIVKIGACTYSIRIFLIRKFRLRMGAMEDFSKEQAGESYLERREIN